MISMNLSKSRKRFEKKHRLKENRLYEFFTMFVTFFIVCIGLILFRAESIGVAWEYIQGMLQFGTIKASYRFFTWPGMWPTNLFIGIMLITEWLHRNREHGMDVSYIKYSWVRFAIYYGFILLVLAYYGQEQSFIYFQF